MLLLRMVPARATATGLCWCEMRITKTSGRLLALLACELDAVRKTHIELMPTFRDLLAFCEVLVELYKSLGSSNNTAGLLGPQFSVDLIFLTFSVVCARSVNWQK